MGIIATVATVIAWYAAASLPVWASWAIGYAVAVGGLYALGRALMPDIPDVSIDQGTTLNTTKNNTATVPIVYGENKLAGNKVFEATTEVVSGADNKDYFSINVLTDHEIEEFVSVYRPRYEGIYQSTSERSQQIFNSGYGISLRNVYVPIPYVGSTYFSTFLGDNLTISASSNPVYISRLTDGSFNTIWYPTSTVNEWIKIYHNQSATIYKVSLLLPNQIQYVGDYILTYHTINFKLQYSDNDIDWFDASNSYSNNGGYNTNSWVDIAPTETNAHLYWRVYFTVISNDSVASTDPSGVYEIAVDSSLDKEIILPPNISFLAVWQKYEITDQKSIQLDNVQAVIKGKKIRYFVDSSTISSDVAYSNSPPAIALDILTSYMNVEDTEIDIESFYNAQQFASSNLLTCNIVFDKAANIDSALQAVCSTMRSVIVYSDNKWKFIYDHYRDTYAYTINSDDIVEKSMNIAMPNSVDLGNKVVLKYINPDDEWQVATAEYEDLALIELDGYKQEKVIEVKGCTNKEQAYKLAELALNKMRYTDEDDALQTGRKMQTPLNISFKTTLKNSHIEVGDIVRIQHELIGDNRRFEILSVKADMSGSLEIEATQHCKTHYTDALGNFLVS